MKTSILLTLVLLLFANYGIISKATAKPAVENESIQIFSSPEIKGLAESWISEYSKTNLGLQTEIGVWEASEITTKLADKNILGFVIQRPEVSLADQSAWRMVVGRDVIVAVINSENPFMETLNEKGVSEKELSAVLKNEVHSGWGKFTGNSQNESIKVIMLDDPEIQSSVSKFLEIGQSLTMSFEKKPVEEFIRAITTEKYAIGFCNLAAITDVEQHGFKEGIALLPIDRNENDHLDYNENIYADLNQFERSVWIGKYPRTLICNIYAVAKEFPANSEISDFLNWIIVSGQSVVEQSGYTNLVYNEVQSNLEKLNPPVLITDTQKSEGNRLSTILLIALVIITGTLIITFAVRNRSKNTRVPLGNFSRHAKILNENKLSFPGGLYFDKSHTWVFMEEQGMVKFGIDDFMPHVTGDFTRIILKNPGEKVKRREPVVTLIQKGKQITINAPVSGTIKEINETLIVEPNMVNISPYTDGWVYKIEPSNWFREIQFFKLGDEYKEWIKSEINRLKDFLACSFNLKNLTESKLAFQEGGELMPEPLKNLEPKIWEDFQNYFIESVDKY